MKLYKTPSPLNISKAQPFHSFLPPSTLVQNFIYFVMVHPTKLRWSTVTKLSIFVFQGKIVAQGKLLLRGPLFCTDDPTSGPNFKMREMTVFLFEQVFSYSVHFITNGALRNQVKRLLQFWTLTTFNQQIMLFAETVGKKTQFTSPNYNYKAHIQV